MRVVVAPDKFKGSLTAVEAAEAIGEGLRQGRPGVDVVLAPVADGGDGTVDAAVAAGYDRVTTTVAGPTGEPVTASFAVSGDTAVIEMAEAAGLRRLPGGRPAPLTATTSGVGELILAALDRGVGPRVERFFLELGELLEALGQRNGGRRRRPTFGRCHIAEGYFGASGMAPNDE